MLIGLQGNLWIPEGSCCSGMNIALMPAAAATADYSVAPAPCCCTGTSIAPMGGCYCMLLVLLLLCCLASQMGGQGRGRRGLKGDLVTATQQERAHAAHAYLPWPDGRAGTWMHASATNSALLLQRSLFAAGPAQDDLQIDIWRLHAGTVYLSRDVVLSRQFSIFHTRNLFSLHQKTKASRAPLKAVHAKVNTSKDVSAHKQTLAAMGELVPITSTSGVLMVPDRSQQLADYEKRLKEVRVLTCFMELPMQQFIKEAPVDAVGLARGVLPLCRRMCACCNALTLPPPLPLPPTPLADAGPCRPLSWKKSSIKSRRRFLLAFIMCLAAAQAQAAATSITTGRCVRGLMVEWGSRCMCVCVCVCVCVCLFYGAVAARLCVLNGYVWVACLRYVE
jgi:hypothetical protein